MKRFLCIALLITCLFCPRTFAETRGAPYTPEQLFEMSTLVFEGTVLDIETVTEYRVSFPIQAKVEKVLKGHVSSGDILMGYKHPGLYAYFEAEYNVPKDHQQGTFYVIGSDGSFSLIGYITRELRPRLTPGPELGQEAAPSGI